MSPEVDADSRYATLLAARVADRWEPDSAIDWDAPVRLPRWLPRRLFVRAISQLYHGEVATATACLRLADELERTQPLAGQCLRAQADDETRHAEVFRRYLQRIGDLAPMDPPFVAAIAAATADGLPPAARTVAFNIVLEGEAVQLLHAFARHVSCPLLNEIVYRTARDEARHVAFGKYFVKSAAAAMDDAGRAALAEQIVPIWETCGAELVALYAGPFGAWIGRGTANRRWLRHAEVLSRLGIPVSASPIRP